MAEVNTRSCDECGKMMLTGDRWFAMAIANGVIAITPMVERKLIAGMFQAAGHVISGTLDLCSIDCIGRKIAK